MKTNCPHHPTPSQRPLEFKLPSFAEDEKLAFVDSVCRTLMKSRFGDGAMYTSNPRFEGTSAKPCDYLGLLEEESFGWHEAATFLGRTILGRALSGDLLQKPARSKGIPFIDEQPDQHLSTLSPANLGRGSPTFLGRSSSRFLCVP
ncbi:MAG: hypothetical protein IPO41_13955 [Acidobacteria bacterium]|nr:hypothetical protein [Acidobacteriota bacterium]MBK9529379.1 hypothetical protein [Acidobacteriota bacterium]MBP7475791.1 hypothetical protein [Pyrinomonadaceae bacterium]